MSEKISCTVAVLTKDSATTLERALRSVKDFAEILVCDGGSTDGTLEIAARYGARIMPQNKAFLDVGGNIKDFAGVRNQTLTAATYEWFLYLDADEYFSPEFVQEIKSITARPEPAAYWVPRRFVLSGVAVERSIAYPNQQMRLFHRGAVKGFRKPIHEHVELLPNARVARTVSAMFVPIDTDLASQQRKTSRYITMELDRLSPLTLKTVISIISGVCKLLVLYFFRLIRVYIFERGTRMPLLSDMQVVRYQTLLASRALRRYLTR